MPKQTNEERLLKKRLAERRRKARIKSDPERAEALRKRERERYHQKKREGKLVSVQEMSQRERRALQRRNKIYQKEYYQKRKAAKRLLKEAESNASPQYVLCCSASQRDTSFDRRVDARDPFASSSNTTRLSLRDNESAHSGASIAKNLRPRRCRGCHSPETRILHQITTQTQCSNNLQPTTIRAPYPYHTRNLRASSPQEVSDIVSHPASPLGSINVSTISVVCPDSPNSDSTITSVDFKREFANKFRRYKKSKVKELQLLQRRITELKRENATYRKRVQRLQNIQTVTKTKDLKERLPKPNTINKYKNTYKNKQIRSDVIKFYEDDENSRLCPGKRDTVTRHQLKKQKRLLVSSLKVLHKKYLNLGHTPISYTSFCRMKPFWVVKPSISNRNTCMCQIHANMELITMALKTYKVITENTITDLLQSMCCDKNNVNCLLRKCSDCKNKTILYKEFDNSNTMVYWKWDKSTRAYVHNNVEKSANIIEKMRLVEKPLQVIKVFESHLETFLKHCGNIRNQTDAVNKIKQNLGDTECLVHIDYSENYSTKYGSEIQAVHFGASRQQLTLHTGVIYYRCALDQTLKTQAFCTISTSLRHDASAVWAHMVPILAELDKTVPEMSTLHIVSDSPSAQYRNKKIFYIVSQLSSYCPNLTSVLWHYCECGHGKGAPDGVGGVLKRTADQLVAYGNDITDIDSLIDSLRASTKSVKIQRVEDYEIVEKDWLIPDQLKAFPGTMKVHEVIWTKCFKRRLALRSLSCVEPQCLYSSAECLHGKHLGFYYLPGNNDTGGEIQHTIREEVSSRNIDVIESRTDGEHSKNIRSLIQKDHVSSQKSVLPEYCRQMSVQRFKGSERFVLGHLGRSSTSQLQTSSRQYIQQQLDTTLLSKYTTEIRMDLKEAAVPSSTFFENMNSDIFSKFEKSTNSTRNENITGEKSSPDSDSDISDYELNIF